MSDRGSRVLGKRRLTAIAMGITGVVAVLTLVGVLAFYVTTAHGSGTGGSFCLTGNGPVCTFKNNLAINEFQSVSSDGCTYTDAQVTLFDDFTGPGHNGTPAVALFVSKWNECTGVNVEAAANTNQATGEPDFTGTVQFSGDGKSATVNGTAPMSDLNTGGLLFTTTINVVVNGYGPISSFSDNSHNRTPAYIMNFHSSGKISNAEASGTFTDEAGNNLAALPSINGFLESANGGTVQVIRR